MKVRGKLEKTERVKIHLIGSNQAFVWRFGQGAEPDPTMFLKPPRAGCTVETYSTLPFVKAAATHAPLPCNRPEQMYAVHAVLDMCAVAYR